MSVWSHFEGVIVIPIDKHISVRKVLEDTLHDDMLIYLSTVKEGVNYRHTLEVRIEMEGDELCERKDALFAALHAKSIDLTFTLRFMR